MVSPLTNLHWHDKDAAAWQHYMAPIACKGDGNISDIRESSPHHMFISRMESRGGAGSCPLFVSGPHAGFFFFFDLLSYVCGLCALCAPLSTTRAHNYPATWRRLACSVWAFTMSVAPTAQWSSRAAILKRSFFLLHLFLIPLYIPSFLHSAFSFSHHPRGRLELHSFPHTITARRTTAATLYPQPTCIPLIVSFHHLHR